MATRPAGSGVLVTLVVFVLTTVAFLVLAVVFYSQMSSSIDDARKEKSLVTTLNASMKTLNEETEKLKANQVTLTTERDAIASKLAESISTISGSSKQLNEIKSQLEASQKLFADAQAQQALAIEEAKKTIAPFSNATGEYSKSVQDMQKVAQDSRDDLERSFKARIDEMQKNIDGLSDERANLRARLEQAEKKLSQFEVKPEDPSSLVDGHIIEIGGPDSTVYLDIGRKHRVVPGMTFEVFTTADQVQNTKDGKIRGKASIQVLRVTEDTSTARVTRSAANQPITRNDVLINAVYSPTYTYRMLVHGKFDVNNDKKFSAGEASVVRDQIKAWGAQVVDGDKVTGDLDFVVIGIPPSQPAPLSSSAGDIEIQAYTQSKNDYDTYNRIMKEAMDARIPVLNWNRFQALTGQGN